MGFLLLEGGAEFGGQMREPDLQAIERAGGFAAPVRILPAAAAPDHNHDRAGGNGVRWFQSLGSEDVQTIPVIDGASANEEENARALREAKLVYLLGGFTHYLGQTLRGSLAWLAILDAYQNGAVIAGSSAGAMVMCQYYYDPGAGRVHEGLNLIPNSLVLPHHDTFGKAWAPRLRSQVPEVTLIGIDEQTGMIDDGTGQWTVHGKRAVTLYSGSGPSIFQRGASFSL